ncbi:hypothetical protein FBU59_006117, partial [Linderina macrospora]
MARDRARTPDTRRPPPSGSRRPIDHRMQPSQRRPPAGRSRRDEYEDDESEYDSLDDFVVDDEDEGRYRAGAIREMFGIQYRDVDDDDDDYNMESSAMQQMNEERRSAKIGKLEDKREEERLAAEERE